MSNGTKGAPAFISIAPWLVPLAATVVVAAAVISYSRSGDEPVAGGSPYYDKAVKEALAGLRNPGGKALPETRPALPAGLSPDEYYWCEQCKAYHKRQPAQGQPGAVPPSPVAGGNAPQAAAQPSDAIPPLPAGLSADDYYWCTNCKAYHKRQATPGQPGADAAHPPAAAGDPAHAAVAQGSTEAIPPLPEGLSPNDYYWCANCKAYHPRQAGQPAPAGSDGWRGVPYRLPQAPGPKPEP